MPSAETKSRIKSKLWEETKLMLWLSLYIFMFLAALAGHRAILLGEGGTGVWPLAHCALEALVLAKVILIGNAIGLGERLRQERLVMTTIIKSITFTIFALAFSGLEELVVGLVHGRAFGEMMHEAKQLNLKLLAARAVMLFIYFLPLFALWGIGRRLGEGKLYEMFFHAHREKAGAE